MDYGPLSGEFQLDVIQLKTSWNCPHYQKQTDDCCSSCLECATVVCCTQWVKPISRQEKMASQWTGVSKQWI